MSFGAAMSGMMGMESFVHSNPTSPVLSSRIASTSSSTVVGSRSSTGKARERGIKAYFVSTSGEGADAEVSLGVKRGREEGEEDARLGKRVRM